MSDNGDDISLSFFGCFATWICLVIGAALVAAGMDIIGIEPIPIDPAALEQAMATMGRTVLAIAALFTLLILVLGLLEFASWILNRAENAAAGLALTLEGKRKKEYDDHYDALLSQPEQDDSIAYYEDDAISHLTNK